MSTARKIAFTCLFVAVLVAIWMYYRTTQELLWGYAPLLLYLTGFFAYFLLRNYPRRDAPKPDRWLAVASGLLLGTGFAGDFGVAPFLFVGLAPLFALLRRLRTRSAGYGEVFRHGFTGFLLFNILATYWVTNTGFGAGFFAMLANAVLMCVPWLFAYWISARLPRWALLAFAVAWLSFEFTHYRWELNWPWLTLGNGLANRPSLIQWYEITGALGGSLWLLGCNWLAYATFFAPARRRPDAGLDDTQGGEKRKEERGRTGHALEEGRRPGPRWTIALVALILFPIGGSLVRYFTYAAPAGETISVAAIQPNFEPHYEKFADRRQAAPLDTFLRLSRAALAAGPVDYLVFPETSFRDVEEAQPLASAALRTLNAELSGRGADYLVTGVSGFRLFAPGEPLTRAVRYSGSTAYEGLNAAVQWKLGTDAAQTYRKGVFVPGAESFPFRSIFPFMEPLVASVGGSVAGLGTQAQRTPLTSEKASIAPVICYESVFGEYFTDYVREGAQAVFVMTNDGWWDNTAGHRQHLWYSSLRAIETRRAVVRAANVGACAFIDQRGDIVSRTTYDRAGFLRGELRLNDATTPYVRYGDLVGRAALLLTLLLLVGGLVVPFTRRK